jgi:glycopeptide antibiotics resistance protein
MKNKIIDSVVLLVIFNISRLIWVDILFFRVQFYLGRFSFLMGHEAFWMFCILGITLFLFAMYYQLRHRVYLKKLNLVLYGIYFSALFFLLLMRREIGGAVSLNPVSFISDVRNGGTFEVVGNLFMLTPLGILLSRYSFLKGSAWILATLLVVEILQYILNIGFFDLGDIVLNYSGYLIGIGFSSVYREKVLKLS